MVNKKVKHSRILLISIVVNALLFFVFISLLVYYRQAASTLLIQKVFDNFNKVPSYHLEASTNVSTLYVSADHIKDSNKYKQILLGWKYKSNLESVKFIYNRDNLFIKINSLQLRDFIDKSLFDARARVSNSEFAAIKEKVLHNPIFTGMTYLKLDKINLDGFLPSGEYEKEILESNEIVGQQIIKSLQFRGIPRVVFIEHKPYLKLPLKLDYQKLNSILYPSVKSYIVSDQVLFRQILNKVQIDLYIDPGGKLFRVVCLVPVLSEKQIKGVFGGETGHNRSVFWELNDYIIDSVSKIKKNYVITVTLSQRNKKIDIKPPANHIKIEDFVQSMSYEQSNPIVKPAAQYRVNNALKIKSSGSDVDKNFYMVSNMLYRYYSDHGVYPSTLDQLAGKYFPDMVPGNPKTAQGFHYSTFGNSKGYLLCPTADSLRGFCFKKYYLDEIE